MAGRAICLGGTLGYGREMPLRPCGLGRYGCSEGRARRSSAWSSVGSFEVPWLALSIAHEKWRSVPTGTTFRHLGPGSLQRAHTQRRQNLLPQYHRLPSSRRLVHGTPVGTAAPCAYAPEVGYFVRRAPAPRIFGDCRGPVPRSVRVQPDTPPSQPLHLGKRPPQPIHCVSMPNRSRHWPSLQWCGPGCATATIEASPALTAPRRASGPRSKTSRPAKSSNWRSCSVRMAQWAPSAPAKRQGQTTASSAHPVFTRSQRCSRTRRTTPPPPSGGGTNP